MLKYLFLLIVCPACLVADQLLIPMSSQGRITPLNEFSKEQLWHDHFFNDQTQDPFGHMLPAKNSGEWLSLSRLKNSKTNFTAYDESHFQKLRALYLELAKAFANGTEKQFLISELGKELNSAYATIAGNQIIKTKQSALNYPSMARLKAEQIYSSWPFITILTACYCFTFCFLFFSMRWGIAVFIVTFLMHSSLLALRSYILERPPVSNMFETVIYVPWISAGLGLILFSRYRTLSLLFCSSFVAFSFLLLLKAFGMQGNLENVQAVLNSQFWLLLHVLMVVGSYGVFALGSVLGHVFLLGRISTYRENSSLKLIAKAVLQTSYIGVALLTIGTILGGVWAAESWGRFWDWDPKESWAFISICTYLLWIHAFRFRYIGDYGLCVGAILGFLSISFTWYGVNYLLGTGLHSYGFGSGGQPYYFAFLAAESLFLIAISYLIKIGRAHFHLPQDQKQSKEEWK